MIKYCPLVLYERRIIMSKRIFAVLMVFALGLGLLGAKASTENIRSVPISVSVNNQFVAVEDASFNYKGVAYGPLRAIAESMGADSLVWDSATSSAKINIDNKNIKVTNGSSTIYVNSVARNITYPAVLNEGKLSLPIGIIVDILGGQCNWEKSTMHMQIYKKGCTVPQQHKYNRSYSEDDVVWLSKIINAESGGESLTGKIAVGNVVLNRVKSSEYPNTIYGVIFDKNHGVQFEPVINGSVYNTPSYDSILAAKMALEGTSHVGNSLFFCNPVTSTNSWIKNNRPFYSMIGNHAFYL